MLLQLNEVPYKRRRQLEVVELRDIEKDYALIHACLQLAQKSNQRSSHVAAMSRTMSASRRADEVVVLLVDAGLFDVAVDICRLFDIKMDVVFEHLAVRCKHQCFPHSSLSIFHGRNLYHSVHKMCFATLSLSATLTRCFLFVYPQHNS